MKNKIYYSEIQHLLNQVSYEFARTGESGIYCTAYLGSFKVAVGYSGCVDPANYSQELGEKYSKERCVKETQDKLWELMGFALFKDLNKDLFLQSAE